MPEETSSDLLSLYQRLVGSPGGGEVLSSHFSFEKLLALIESAKMWVGTVHDLKNQFGVVVGHLTYLAERGELTESQKKHIQIAVDTLLRGEKILERSTQMMSGNGPRLEKVPLHPLLETALLEVIKYREMIPGRFSIEKIFDPEISEIKVDPVQMERVFFNLIRNAVQAMKESQVGDTLRITTHQLANEVYVSIRDNGPGIPESILGELGQTALTTRRAKGGSGLGLMIVNQLVKAHSGRVEMKNVPEGGAVFTVILPL